MKKVVTVLIAIILITGTVLAYTSTVTVKEVCVEVSGEEGSNVEIIPKVLEVDGWRVVKGNITVADNEFTMPAEDVEIEGIVTDGYVLSLDFPYFVREEEREEGEEITVSATSTEEEVFSSWTATGITLTEEQITNPTITFTMPKSNVTLVADYTRAAPYTITTIEHAGGNVEGVYTNHKCSVCGGKDHECEAINITIKADHASASEI